LQIFQLHHVLFARFTPSRPVVDQHGVALERREIDGAPVERLAFERNRASDRLQPQFRARRLLGDLRRSEVLDDLRVPGERFVGFVGEFLSDGQLKHRVGGVRHIRVGFDEPLQPFDPAGLDLGRIGVRIGDLLAVLREQMAEFDVRDEVALRLLRAEAFGERLQPLNALWVTARLHRGTDRIGQLPNPGRTLFIVFPGVIQLFERIGTLGVELGQRVRRGRLRDPRLDRFQFLCHLLQLGAAFRSHRPRQCRVVDAEEIAAGGPGRFVVQQIAGQIDESPCVTGLDERADGDLRMGARRLDDRGDVFIDEQILGGTIGAGGQQAGLGRSKVGPDGLVGHHFLLAGQIGEPSPGGGELAFDIGCLGLAKAQVR